MPKGSRGGKRAKKTYTYYLISRQAGPGTVPKEGIVSVDNYDRRKQVDAVGRRVWGRITYDRQLSEDEKKRFDLTEPPKGPRVKVDDPVAAYKKEIRKYQERYKAGKMTQRAFRKKQNELIEKYTGISS